VTCRKCLLLVLALALLVGLSGCKEPQKSGAHDSGWVEVPIKMEELKTLQVQVDEGHRPGFFNPRQVTYEFCGFLESRLKIPGNSVKEMKEVSVGKSGVQLLVTLEDGKKLEFVLVQPVK